MARTADSFLDRIRHRQTVAGWRQLADRAARLEAGRLDLLRDRAAEVRGQIDRLLHAADARLDTPALPAGTDRLPPGTDWVWRPDPWAGRLPAPGLAAAAPATAFGPAVQLFHDCPLHEIALRQRRNPAGRGLPPFALELEVFGFEGGFLSLAIDLPSAAAEGLGPRHLVRLDAWAESECPVGLYARLNLRHGPNVERMLRQLSLSQGERVVEFDLGYARLTGGRVDALWLDLIFEAPAMNRIALREVMLSRHPRAPL